MFQKAVFALVWCLSSALSAQVRMGHAEVEITPPEKMPMAGYYYVRLNEGTHDPLMAKAIVLEAGGVKAVLVGLDLVQIPRAFVEDARKIIEAKTGIPGAHVMISATHSHTGPELGTRLRNVAPDTETLAKGYWAKLPQLIADSVIRAFSRMTPVTVQAATGEEASISFIRRFRMMDGSTGWNPGKLNPKIVKPLSRIDPAVPAVMFRNAENKPEAVYVNFALHLDTVGGTKFSADYPFTMNRNLRDVMGPQVTALFTIGCAGNINHIDVTHNRPQKGPGEAARIGTVLSAAALKALEKASPVNEQTLRVSSKAIALEPAPFDEADLTKAKAVVDNFGKQNANPFYDQVHAFKVMELAARGKQPFDAEVQVISLGQSIAWVGLPGEIFVEHGRAIKNASPFPITIVAALANGNLGYVPDRKAYGEGAYEVISSRLAEGSGEAMVASAVAQLVAAFGTAAKDTSR